MVQKLDYSSTFQIHTEIQVQLQDTKYGWLACTDNETLLVCITTSVPHQLRFLCPSQQI